MTIKNPATGLARTQTATSSGTFSFDFVPPGDYTLEVEAAGFKKAIRTVQALVGSIADADVRLEVGGVDQVVTVEGGAGVVTVNTQDATLGNNFENEQITQLPVPAQSRVQTLLTLQPGVTRDGAVSGARSDQSNITLDGVDINDQQIQPLIPGQEAVNPLATNVLRLNSEAIEEFRVTTMNANAEQGRSSAAQVNLVTKSGTNNLHGAAFEEHQNNIFNANDFFNNRAIPQVPVNHSIRNIFGGGIGGPLKKDKLFFFYSFEGDRWAKSDSVSRFVPLANLGQGSLRYIDVNKQVQTLTEAQLNQIFNTVHINDTGVAFLAAAAAKYQPNDNAKGDQLNTGGFRFNAPTPAFKNSHVARFDWNAASTQTVFARLNVIYDHVALLSQFPDTPSPNIWSHPWGFVVGHTWSIGHSLTNNLRYGFTRQAFSQQGDSNSNQVSFRFVFDPFSYSRTLNRVTPVHNILDDVAWVKGSHTLLFGTNIRLIRNRRTSFGTAYDFVSTNPSGYQQGGNVLSDPIVAYLAANNLPAMDSSSISPVQNAAAALIGRFSNYTANFTFGHDGSLFPQGTPSKRDFATESYDFYAQDAWKIRRNLTLTYGLRYTLGRPIYETNGLEVRPSIPLGTLLRQRIASAAKGIPDNTLFSTSPSGPANGGKPMYDWDYTDFQPRVAVAWQPAFEHGFLGALFGKSGKSVIRGGFAITNDYYGEALATFFDLNNILGYASSQVIPVNTYNVTSAPAPAFTGLNQDVRALPLISTPAKLTFPLSQNSGPAGDFGDIESSLDSNLRAPREYTWNFTFERQFPAGLLFQAAYIGRLGHNLLLQRDVAQPNDLVDPNSGMDWYTAATSLEKIRQTRPGRNTAVPTMAYFDNIFPANLRDTMVAFEGVCKPPTPQNPTPLCIPAGFTPTQTVFWLARNFFANDWTDLQFDLEAALGQNLFFGPQNASLSTWSTTGNSLYHGLALSVRQRFRGLQWDFNYTLSHSLDDASGLQNSVAFGGGSFVRNSIRQHDNYASSDFDLRHVVNVNGIYELPLGRGKTIGGSSGRGLDALIGGWQLSGIFRWNTGLPLNAPIDDARWATNFQVQSWAVLAKPLSTCVSKGSLTAAPKIFCDPTAAYQSFRNPYPGETGQRNLFRYPGYVALDAGLGKSLNLPWSEKQKLQFRLEVFNVTNTQHFGRLAAFLPGGTRSNFGIAADPAARNLNAPSDFANFGEIQGTPRYLQIGLRYSF